MKIETWIAPARVARAQDTQAVIDDATTRVAWFRNGASRGYLDVRIIVGRSQSSEERGGASRARVADATILAPEGTSLEADDTLQAAGSVTYRIVYVHPRQQGKTSARAEVWSQ